MNSRMGVALLSLGGGLLSLYLYLYKIGAVGTLACGDGGGCDAVQFSPQAQVLGVEVTLIGILGYGLLFVMAMVGLQPRWSDARWTSTALVALAGGGLLFTAYLKYQEFFVIGSVCKWCVGSAVLMVLIFLFAVLDRRRLRAAPE